MNEKDNKQFWDEVAKLREELPLLTEEAHQMIAYQKISSNTNVEEK